MKQLLDILRHLVTQNKKFLVLILLYIILGYLYINRKKLEQNRKLQLIYQRNISRIKTILKDLEVDANFTLNYAHLKYKDKPMIDKSKKKDQILNEFKYVVIRNYVKKHQLTEEDFYYVINRNQDLKKQFNKIIDQFDQYKDQKPEPLDVYISKFNSQSMKTIYQKYLAYLRFLVYQNTKKLPHYSQRFEMHKGLMTNEGFLKDIFALYIMNFDDQNINFDKTEEGSYFREFRKAQYQLMFEKQYSDETYELENQHLQLMSMILEYGNKIKSDTWMNENPAEVRKKGHGEETDLPAEISLSITTVNKELIRKKYEQLLVEALSYIPQTICLMQTYTINPSIIKLRLFRDKVINQNLINSDSRLLNTSQGSQDTQGGGGNTGNAVGSSSNKASRKRMGNFVPLTERLKQGLTQQIGNTLQSQLSQSPDTNQFKLDNSNLMISENLQITEHLKESSGASNYLIEESKKEE